MKSVTTDSTGKIIFETELGFPKNPKCAVAGCKIETKFSMLGKDYCDFHASFFETKAHENIRLEYPGSLTNGIKS
jgi:hypothetical protein